MKDYHPQSTECILFPTVQHIMIITTCRWTIRGEGKGMGVLSVQLTNGVMVSKVIIQCLSNFCEIVIYE